MSQEAVDVAIIGGGVSGVYAGWRLRTMRGPDGGIPSVTVFEGSKRIGGRLLSLTPPGMPHIRCELGGMRYESIHTLVCSLVKKFGLETVELPVEQDGNIAYLRGLHLRTDELGDSEKVPYRLRDGERGRPPGHLLTEFAVNEIIPGATELTHEELVRAARESKFDGRSLYDQGFWNVLHRVLSNEAYEFCMDGSGYDSLTSNWNAADAIPWLLADFSPEIKYRRIVDGFDTLPRRLREEFEAAGGEVRLEWSLRSFDVTQLRDGSTGVNLRFANGSEVVAKSLILALPRRALELLDPTGAVMDRDNIKVRDLIRSVEPISLFKLFICYPEPWWEELGVSQGRSITDLPLRQCYYWGVEGNQEGADPSNRNAVLLASYDDERYTSFWSGLRWPHEKSLKDHLWKSLAFVGHLPELAAQAAGSDSWREYLAPKPMIDEAHRQLVELHKGASAREPTTAVYRDWQEDPYGGGVHFWKPYCHSWKRIPAITQPMAGVPVHICGEAYSHQQGWVEGALQTTEFMLGAHFHLPRPEWEEDCDE